MTDQDYIKAVVERYRLYRDEAASWRREAERAQQRCRDLELKISALQSDVVSREAWAQGALRIMAQIKDGVAPAPD